MAGLSDVLVVSATAAVGRGVRETLEEAPSALQVRSVTDADGARSPEEPDPDVVLLIPRTWDEMARWAPVLTQQLPCCRWLVMAEWRVT
jgi:hypothetical protein